MFLSYFGKWLKIFIVSLTLLAVACSQGNLVYPVLDGDKLDWEQLRGKVVFINYWAEWCKPCRDEIPELNRFASAHADQVVVLSVNFDGVREEILRTQVKSLDIKFPTLLVDPRAEFGVAGSGALPETLVFDRAGEVFKVLVGPQTGSSLEAVLAEVKRAGQSAKSRPGI